MFVADPEYTVVELECSVVKLECIEFGADRTCAAFKSEPSSG